MCNKPILYYPIGVLGVLMAIFLAGCPDPDPPEPDPCADAVPIAADFTLLEDFYADSLFATDTVLMGNFVHFVANEGYDSVRWRVGFDDRVFTDPSFRLRFLNITGTFPVQLIAWWTPDTLCFPEDPGVDTLQKLLEVVPWENSAVIGTYHGYHQGTPEDTFTVQIAQQGNWYKIYGINPDCTNPDTIASTLGEKIGYTALEINGSGWYGDGCLGPQGFATIDESRQQLTVRYTIGDTSKPFTTQGYPQLQFTFIGTRK